MPSEHCSSKVDEPHQDYTWLQYSLLLLVCFFDNESTITTIVVSGNILSVLGNECDQKSQIQLVHLKGNYFLLKGILQKSCSLLELFLNCQILNTKIGKESHTIVRITKNYTYSTP